MNSKIIIQKILVYFLVAYLTIYLFQSMVISLKDTGLFPFLSDGFNVIRTLTGLLIGVTGLHCIFKWDNKILLNFTTPLITATDFVRYIFFSILTSVIIFVMLELI